MLLSFAGANVKAQGAGGDTGGLAGASSDQGGDSRSLSQHRVFRRRRATASMPRPGATSASARKSSRSAESAMLAGLVRAPSALAPHRNLDRARERAELCSHAMVETGADQQSRPPRPGRNRPSSGCRPRLLPGTNYLVDTFDGGDTTPGRRGRQPICGSPPRSISSCRLGRERDQQTAGGRRRGRKVGQAALIAMTPDGAIVAMVGGA